ncbi:MAG: diacylglycerol kinase [Gammaproteobacteria bacterium]|nr:diacylglycerol kinase [Gammaproteobacteria bacterium]
MEKNTGIKRIVKAAGYSIQGLRAAFAGEAAFRQECVLALVFVSIALVVDFTVVERVVLISLTLLVLVVELLNSAIEAVVDRFGEELHELSGRAKDMGSAAVLVMLIIWAYAWLAISFF